MSSPSIVAALRTPIGGAGRSLAEVTAAELAARVIGPVAEQVGVPTEVVLGNCLGPGGNVARVAALSAGLPIETSAMTIDRQCGSGLAAIEVAAGLLAAHGGMLLAGGVESASTAPWRFWPPHGDTEPVRYERAPFAPQTHDDPDMAVAADLLAAEAGITREQQDAYAARSHQRAWHSVESGLFDGEVVPMAELKRDERPRPRMTAERLSRLPPVVVEGGTVTTGNLCGVNDGAAVVAITDDPGSRPHLRILATASAGVASARPGRGLVPAVQMTLGQAGLSLDDVDVIEFNEAFAGQVLACCDELKLDPERVCVDGGALALGHPWGASGAILAVRLFSQLVRTGRGGIGLAAIAAGGGQGTAMVVRACL